MKDFLIAIIGVILGFAIGFGILGLIFWGVGSLVVWAFHIDYVWTFWHGLAVGICFELIGDLFKREIKINKEK